MRAALLLFILSALLSKSAQQRVPKNAQLPDMHTSLNSLDWAGTYEGVLTSPDRPGIKTTLTINRDGSYHRVSQHVVGPEAAQTVNGSFTWQANGNVITLDEQGGGQQFSVGEGRLSLINDAGNGESRTANLVLMMVPQTASSDDLTKTLEGNRWTLESATDSQNRPIEVLAPQADRPVVFLFSGTRLSIQGPCNRIMGGYQLNAAAQLTVNGAASGMMACAPALMKGDAVLSRVLAKPMHVELRKKGALRLRLVSAENETLELVGEATPESLYGAPTIIFLEVSDQQVSCENPPAPKTRCLQVRERRYDEKGLPVGTPGQWQPLHQNIEGYAHKEGIRNVLRVKRFNRKPTSPDGPPNLYVLDIVVESELVQR
jgi:heat shock protein HslJ